MDTSAGPCDSPAVVNRSMRLQTETSPAFDRARRSSLVPASCGKLRAGRGKRIRKRSDDNPSGSCSYEYELPCGRAVGCLDRTDNRILDRNRSHPLVAVHVVDFDQWPGRYTERKSRLEGQRIR